VITLIISADLREVIDDFLTITTAMHVFYGSRCSVDTGVVCQGVYG
jgi:hypothetical protein